MADRPLTHILYIFIASIPPQDTFNPANPHNYKPARWFDYITKRAYWFDSYHDKWFAYSISHFDGVGELLMAIKHIIGEP